MNEVTQVGSARAYRARLSKPVELPSGAIWMLRRPRLDLYVSAGRIPQSLMREGMEAWKATADGAAALEAVEERITETLEQDEQTAAEMFVFMRELVCDAVVKPQIVEGADPNSDEEIDPSEIDAADFTFILNWITDGSPGLSIKTEEGEISHAGLNSFRSGQARVSAGDSEHGGEVRMPAASVTKD